MIEVHIDRAKHLITVQGHAARPEGTPPGSNIICAAVSAITLTLIEGLECIANERISARVDTGDVFIEWDELSDIGSALIDTWFIGILKIQEAYGEITII